MDTKGQYYIRCTIRSVHELAIFVVHYMEVLFLPHFSLREIFYLFKIYISIFIIQSTLSILI